MTDIKSAIQAAYVAGATAVHETWVAAAKENEGPLYDTPDFTEAASDYAKCICLDKTHEWRCFHCGMVFTDESKAAQHFGPASPVMRAPECIGYSTMALVAMRSNSAFKRFTEQILNGLDTGLLKIDTHADETWARVIERVRSALAENTKYVSPLFEPSLPAEIEQLRAERDALKTKLDEAREVIAPFALEASYWGDAADNEHPIIRDRADSDDDDAAFTVGDLRRAHEFIEKNK